MKMKSSVLIVAYVLETLVLIHLCSAVFYRKSDIIPNFRKNHVAYPSRKALFGSTHRHKDGKYFLDPISKRFLASDYTNLYRTGDAILDPLLAPVPYPYSQLPPGIYRHGDALSNEVDQVPPKPDNFYHDTAEDLRRFLKRNYYGFNQTSVLQPDVKMRNLIDDLLLKETASEYRSRDLDLHPSPNSNIYFRQASSNPLTDPSTFPNGRNDKPFNSGRLLDIGRLAKHYIQYTRRKYPDPRLADPLGGRNSKDFKSKELKAIERNLIENTSEEHRSKYDNLQFRSVPSVKPMYHFDPKQLKFISSENVNSGSDRVLKGSKVRGSINEISKTEDTKGEIPEVGKRIVSPYDEPPVSIENSDDTLPPQTFKPENVDEVSGETLDIEPENGTEQNNPENEDLASEIPVSENVLIEEVPSEVTEHLNSNDNQKYNEQYVPPETMSKEKPKSDAYTEDLPQVPPGVIGYVWSDTPTATVDSDKPIDTIEPKGFVASTGLVESLAPAEFSHPKKKSKRKKSKGRKSKRPKSKIPPGLHWRLYK